MDHGSRGDREENDIEVEGGGHNGSFESERRTFVERMGSGTSEDHNLREPLLLKCRTNTTSQIAIVGANICPIESLDYEYAYTLNVLLYRFFFPNSDFLFCYLGI